MALQTDGKLDNETEKPSIKPRISKRREYGRFRDRLLRELQQPQVLETIWLFIILYSAAWGFMYQLSKCNDAYNCFHTGDPHVATLSIKEL